MAASAPVAEPYQAPRAKERGEVGCWWPLQLPNGGASASMTCPVCKQRAYLDGHAIALDGHVTPSVRCPWDGCDWHADLTLIGWALFAPAGRA